MNEKHRQAVQLMNEDDNHYVGINKRPRNSSDDERDVTLQGISALSMSDTSRVKNGADDESTNLGENYEPNANDVICGRGRRAWDHPGNVRFRYLLEIYMAEYKDAKTKLDKSLLVSQIMEEVEEANPPGRFVKQEEGGEWTMVSLATAREKVGQGFRDLLHSKYRSSSTAKKCRRSQASIRPSSTRTITSPHSSDKVPSKSQHSTSATPKLSRAPSLGSTDGDSPPEKILSDSGRGQQPNHRRALTLDDLHIRSQRANSNRPRQLVESVKESDDLHKIRLVTVTSSSDTSRLPVSDVLVTRRREPTNGDSNIDLNMEPIRFEDALDQETTLQLLQHLVSLGAHQPPEAPPASSDISLNHQQQQRSPQQEQPQGGQQQNSMRHPGAPPRRTSSAGGRLQQRFLPTFDCIQFGGGSTVNGTTAPTNLLRQQHWQRMQQRIGDMSTVCATSNRETRDLAHQRVAAWARSQPGSLSYLPPQQQQYNPLPPMLEQQQLQLKDDSKSMSTVRNTIPTSPRLDLEQSLSFHMTSIPQPRQQQQQQQAHRSGPFSEVRAIQRHTYFQPITEPSQPQGAEEMKEHMDTDSLLRGVPWPDQWPFDDDDDALFDD